MGTLSSPYSRLLLVASLASLVGRSQAAWGNNCYYDVYGIQRCDDGLSYGARVGIAIAILALLVALLLVFWGRRRRLARHQQAALNNRLGTQGGAASSAYSGYGQQQQGNAGVPMYGYAPQAGYNAQAGPGGNGGPQYYEPQSQTYNYGPSAETWQPPPPKYEPPPPGSENVWKGPEGSSNSGANMNGIGNGAEGYSTQPPQQVSSTEGYASPPGAPPGHAQPQQGNDNRV